MGLETATHIDDLDSSWPTGLDPVNKGDDHLRMIKAVLKTVFPGAAAAGFATPITASEAEINKLDGLTSTTAELNILDGVTATAAEINKLDGVTATTAEINRLISIAGNGALDAFPTGTPMLFQQTAAPTGWTKQTTHNNKAFRVVSGAASSGGTNSFTTVFGKTATDAHTLDISEMPAHTHTHDALLNSGHIGGAVGQVGANATNGTWTQDSTGGGGSHVHNMDIRVQYVDLIIADKD